MAVLALDIASSSPTGWAVYGKGMDKPFSGSKVLLRPTGSVGEAMERLRGLVSDQHEMHGLTDIVFEAQHLAEGINPQTLFVMIGGGAFVEWIGHRMGVGVWSCDISTWRKHFLGRGSFRKKETESGKVISGRVQAKASCMDVCNALGWHPADDNAADACGILDYYVSIMPKSRQLDRPWRDKLLMAGYRK